MEYINKFNTFAYNDPESQTDSIPVIERLSTLSPTAMGSFRGTIVDVSNIISSTNVFN